MISRAIALGVVLALAGLVGCTTIEAQSVQKFGDAAKALAVAVQDTRDIDNRLAGDIATEDQALLFERSYRGFEYPPAVHETQAVGEVWSPRIVYAKALASYGGALASAVSEQSGPDIDTAVSDLQKAVATAAPKLAAKGAFRPASTFAGTVFDLGARQVSMSHIRAAIARADPLIADGRDLMRADFQLISLQVSSRYDSWMSRKRSALLDIQADPRASRAEKYHAYRDFLTEQQTMSASVALLVSPAPGGAPGYERVLDDMVAAHHELLKAKPDPKALENFLRGVAQLYQLISALK